MTTLGSIRKKKAGTWDEAWRDNGILSEKLVGMAGFRNTVQAPLVTRLEQAVNNL
jgi:hypothetical protein